MIMDIPRLLLAACILTHSIDLDYDSWTALNKYHAENPRLCSAFTY